MLKSIAVALTSFVSLSASAAWGLKFEVSPDNGVTWHASLNADPGDVITFRVGSYFDAGTPVTTADGTGPAAQLNRFTGSNIWENFNVGSDSFQNLVRTLPNGSTSVIAVSGNRIGGLTATSFAAQLLLGPLPAEPVTYDEIYRGEIKIGAAIGSPRMLIWKNSTFGVSPNIKGLTFYTYGSPANKLSAEPDGPRTDLNASIFVSPTPGSLAIFGLFGLFARRRRA